MIVAALNVDITKFHTNNVPPTPPHPLHENVVRAATSFTAALLKEDFSTLQSRGLEPSGKWGEIPPSRMPDFGP